MKKFILSGLSVVLMFGGGFKTKTFVYPKENNNNVLLKILSNYNEMGLKYLNFLRNKAGEINLSDNQYLDKAALNHAEYMSLNNIIGHYETDGYEGFTGVTPSDRAVAAGYKSKQVIENLSYGDKDINNSIDGLFSAIYHRFGFLNEWINEVGIGASGEGFVYDMGNSYLNELCNEPQKDINGAYYEGICANSDLKIPVSDVNTSKTDIEKQNAKIIIWPVSNLPISPVFYDEEPDPLPTQSVSGYPISVKFNQYYFNKIDMTDFKLYDENSNEINTILLDKNTDPNNKLSDLEFAIFPKNRLDWGRKYTAVFDYEINGNEKEIKWSFYTKALSYPYYKINSNEFNATILPNKTYAFYFVPQDDNDKFNSVSVSYNVKNLDFDFIDFNTVKVKLTGNVGQKAILTLGNKKLILFIGNSENPKPILYENNETNIINSDNNQSIDLNETKSDYFSNLLNNLTTSWQLKGVSEDINLSEYNKSNFLVWQYINNKWCVFTNNKNLNTIIKDKSIDTCDIIKASSGFWIKQIKEIK